MARKINPKPLLLVLFLLSACTPLAEEKTRVGAILPLTGTFAFYGSEERNGMQVALEEVGDKIDIIWEDSAGENSKAVTAFHKLVNIDKVQIVITSTSWVSNAVYSQAADARVFQAIIASAAFERGRDDDFAVRFTVDVSDEAPYNIEFLQGFDRVAILHLNNDYGKGWADKLSEGLANKVVAVESYLPNDPDVGTQLTKIAFENPDALVLVSTGREANLIARRARELGITAQLVSQRPIQSPELVSDPAPVEGLVYSYPDYDTKHSFVSKYKERFGKEPTVFAAEAYDTIITLAKATQKCGSDAACLHDWFAGRNYSGALGKVVFDKVGDAHYPFALKQVRDGKFVFYER